MLSLSTNDIRLTLHAMELMCIGIFPTASSKTLNVPKAHVLYIILPATLVKEALSVFTSK